MLSHTSPAERLAAFDYAHAELNTTYALYQTLLNSQLPLFSDQADLCRVYAKRIGILSHCLGRIQTVCVQQHVRHRNAARPSVLRWLDTIAEEID
jgi:hypothetical protein